MRPYTAAPLDPPLAEAKANQTGALTGSPGIHCTVLACMHMCRPGHNADASIPRCSLPFPTPSLKAKRGGLANTDAIDMLAAVLKGVLDQTRIDPKVWRGGVRGPHCRSSGFTAPEGGRSSTPKRAIGDRARL